jgi:hypothetical protein
VRSGSLLEKKEEWQNKEEKLRHMVKQEKKKKLTKDRQCRYAETLRHLCVTTVAVEKQ